MLVLEREAIDTFLTIVFLLASQLAAIMTFKAMEAVRGAPCFDGTFSEYKNYRRRATLFVLEKRLEKKTHEARNSLLSGLTKRARDCCEAVDTGRAAH